MSEMKTSVMGVVEIGSLVLDCTALAPFLVDLPRGTRQKLQSTRSGFDLVVAEIMANQVNHGEHAGVTQVDVDTLSELNRYIEQIDEQLPAAEKLVELLVETRAYLDDKRQRQVVAVANAVDNRAKVHGNDTLLARYERTREYRSELGVKSWKTRRKNAVNAGTTDQPIDQPIDQPVDQPIDEDDLPTEIDPPVAV